MSGHLDHEPRTMREHLEDAEHSLRLAVDAAVLGDGWPTSIHEARLKVTAFLEELALPPATHEPSSARGEDGDQYAGHPQCE